jgi:hypothetical protein
MLESGLWPAAPPPQARAAVHVQRCIRHQARAAVQQASSMHQRMGQV